ncbi:MAG: phosphotransferase [candidate division NC10 bacterium]|nr:phosphotransferase [candidate division NC10 bacterium]
MEPGTSSLNPPTLAQPLRGLFERQFGEPVERVAPLRGDASNRKLFRLSAASHTAIGVVNPDARENRAFLEFSSETLDLYREVVELLPRFQIEAGRTLNYDVCYPRSGFDRQSMLWDLNYFKYYFLRLAKIPFSEQALEDDFERFAEFLLQAERRFFLYRDFQSRNIMVREGRPFFIDYQGGRRGALQYDVASLLFDAKADLPFEVRDELLERYLEAAATLEPIDRHAFLTYYPGFVYIRIMQAMGAYGLRGFYERKHHFLASIPYAIRNLEYLLRTTALPVALPELTQVWLRLVASSSLRQFGTASLKLTVRIQSFAYTEGVPTDEKGHGGGYVFDCRALPNPGRFEEYAKLTGQDNAVIAFLENEPAVRDFIRHVFALIDQTVENYQQRNFTDLLVAFGCTGGQHRSVYCAERLAAHLRERFPVNVEVRHLAQENSSLTPGPLPGGEGAKR